MMEPVDIDRYLARIGYEGSREPTAQTLAALQRAHMTSVPFESLDCYLGNPVVVDRDANYAKIVERGRGGFCFELNGMFSWLLEQLGFRVTLLAARPVFGEGQMAPPFAHLTLQVDLEERWLADVGFGMSFLEPLRMNDAEIQIRDGRPYRVEGNDDGWMMWDLSGDEPGGFRFTLEPRALQDFAGMCAEYSTDPDSIFVQSAVYALSRPPDGYVQLSRSKLNVRENGVLTVTELSDDDEWQRLLFEHFGVRL